MRLLNIILVIFFVLTNEIKADNEIQVLENLKRGGNLIFIRHAYAPGGGDPDNFKIRLNNFLCCYSGMICTGLP